MPMSYTAMGQVDCAIDYEYKDATHVKNDLMTQRFLKVWQLTIQKYNE